MSNPAHREWRFSLDDMIGFGEKVLAYSAGFDQSAFVASGLHYDAVARNLELIGEAASHIPLDVRASNPQVPWRLIIATRNRLIHGYLGNSGMLPLKCVTCQASGPGSASARGP